MLSVGEFLPWDGCPPRRRNAVSRHLPSMTASESGSHKERHRGLHTCWQAVSTVTTNARSLLGLRNSSGAPIPRPPRDVNPFRTAVPFIGQTTWNLTGSSPNRDCSPIRVETLYVALSPFRSYYIYYLRRVILKYIFYKYPTISSLVTIPDLPGLVSINSIVFNRVILINMRLPLEYTGWRHGSFFDGCRSRVKRAVNQARQPAAISTSARGTTGTPPSGFAHLFSRRYCCYNGVPISSPPP